MRHQAITSNISIKGQAVALIKLFLGVAMLFACSQIVIPLNPVPITLQTVGLTLIAFLYSPALSFVTILIYLSLGALGLPMFLKFNSGISYMTGVTGGYLLGFLVSASVMSRLFRTFSNRFLNIFISGMVGHIILYALGIAWLSTFVGIKSAIYSGLVVYVPTGILKLAATSYLLSFIKSS